jgi:hypothetical protein
MVVFHQKIQRGAMRATTEAVIKLFVRHHGEGRRFLAVKWATGLVLLPLLFQRHATADQLDDVRARD